jgi:ABC-type amino acid transport substrate-binding protein
MRARRRRTLVAHLALLAAAVVACARPQSPSSSSVRPPAGSPSLRVLISAANPPYSFPEGDRFVGIEVDFANELAVALGRPLALRALDFEEIIDTLAGGGADLAMAGLTVTPAREVQIAFADPWVRSGLLVLVRREDANLYPTPESVVTRGQAIGVIHATTGERYVNQRVGSSAIMAYPTAEAAVDELRGRRIDALVHDAPVVIWFASRDEATLAPILKLLGDEPLAWGMRRGNDTLREQVNEVLARWRSDGTYARIMARWLPYWQRLESAGRSR